MNLAEKILAAHLLPGQGEYVAPGDPVLVKVDGGYSHEFTTAQVHHFLAEEYGPDYRIKDPSKFAVFEDHLIYADGVARMAPFSPKIERLRRLQREFQAHTNVRNFNPSAACRPHLPSGGAREDTSRATHPGPRQPHCRAARRRADWARHREYAARCKGAHAERGARTIRFELVGKRAPASRQDVICTAQHFRPARDPLDRTWSGAARDCSLSPTSAATLANWTPSARRAPRSWSATSDASLDSPNGATGANVDDRRRRVLTPDPGATRRGVHRIDLGESRPWWPPRATDAAPVRSEERRNHRRDRRRAQRIEPGGSCTAGKRDDSNSTPGHAGGGSARPKGRQRSALSQFGSAEVAAYPRPGYVDYLQPPPGRGLSTGCAPASAAPACPRTATRYRLGVNRNYRAALAGRSTGVPLDRPACVRGGKIVEYGGHVRRLRTARPHRTRRASHAESHGIPRHAFQHAGSFAEAIEMYGGSRELPPDRQPIAPPAARALASILLGWVARCNVRPEWGSRRRGRLKRSRRRLAWRLRSVRTTICWSSRASGPGTTRAARRRAHHGRGSKAA